MTRLRAARSVRIKSWTAVAVLAGVVLLSMLLVWQQSTDARREIDALATANTDSAQWSLAQTEVELLALEAAVLGARAGATDLDEVRRRFDVFYSRIDTVQNSRHFIEVVELASIHEAIDEAEAFLAEFVPVIDGPDAGLESALPVMTESLSDLRAATRDFSLAGVRVLSERTETRRERVSSALTDLGLIAVFLLVVLLAMLSVVLWMMRASRKQTEELAVTHSRLQAIISTSLDGILVVDRNGRVLDYNGAAERIFGHSRDEALGQELATLIIPDHLREAHEAGMKRYLDTGEKRVVGKGLVQLEAKHKDGSVFPVEFSINSAESEDGEIFVSYLRDISERVAAQKELVAARDSAVAGEKAKATLLAVMSHEMRTPLNGVLGTLQLLSKTKLDEKQRNYIEMMDTSGQLLLEHVNNVLDISRIDAGKAETTSEEFDVSHLVRGVVSSLQTPANERGNALRVEVLGPGLDTVSGDQARLKQVLFNLIGNAIKFTENGTVTVELEREPGTDTVDFRIIDTGIGIDEADIERVFEDFVTLDASYHRAVEGTGLGLGIVRRLIELLGGEIGVESNPGEGSVFWFRLPLPVVEMGLFDVAPAAAPAASAAPTATSVLLVEDNAINRLVAREMLTQIGCDVKEAHDGQQGVDIAATRRFDLILMDISMPRLDGLEASRLIRERHGPNAKTPIIALTAHAMQSDIERFKAAGMVDVLTKPLSIDHAQTVIRQFAKPEDKAKASGHAAPDEEPENDFLASLGPEFAQKIRHQMEAELSEGFDTLRGMIEGKAPDQLDRKQVAQLAHKLVGTASIGRLDSVTRILRDLEMSAADGMPHDLLALVENAGSAFQHAASTH